MVYDDAPRVRVHYYKNGESENNSNRLIPAPLLSITPEYYYANDVVVGYTYNIVLDGYATALDRRTDNAGTVLEFDDVITKIQYVKNLFNHNGGTLLISYGSGSPQFGQQSELLKAVGGIVKSITFEENDNQWTNYAKYRIELEFNEITVSSDGCGEKPIPLLGCDVPSGILEASNFSQQLMYSLQEYRVKSVNDSWSFTLDEQNAYNSYNAIVNTPTFGSIALGFENQYITIEYNVSAVGKNYYDIEPGLTEKDVTYNLIPAWEQAKKYCQYRVHSQVNSLYTNILSAPSGASINGCSPNTNLEGLLRKLNNDSLDSNLGLYEIYNEQVTCNASEADGSFDVKYSAILKRKISNSNQEYQSANTILGKDYALYTLSVNETQEDDGKAPNKTITVQGTVTGLVPGGIIRSPKPIQFPSSGKLLISTNDTNNGKYSKALSAYSVLADNKNLSPQFAQFLGITYQTLNISVCPGDTIDDIVKTASFSRSDNYSEGTINFSATYSTLRSAQRNSITNVTITTQQKQPVVAEFVIPFRSSGPIIQRINVDTPKRVVVNVEGMLPQRCCPDIEQTVNDLCYGTVIPQIPAFYNTNGYILVDEKFNTALDGSYAVTRTYIECEG